MKKSSHNVWTKFQNDKIIVTLPHGFMPKGGKSSINLRRSASDPNLSVSTFHGYKIEKMKMKLIIHNETVSPASSTSTLVNEENIEPNNAEAVVASKSTGVVDARSEMSRSCSDLTKISGAQSSSSLKHSASCNDMVDTPRTTARVTDLFERIQQYYDAERVYKIYDKLLLYDELFLDTKNQFQLSHPHYWSYLMDRHRVYIKRKYVTKENKMQWDFVELCKKILAKELAEFGKKRAEKMFKAVNLVQNFRESVAFLKINYPHIFIYMMGNPVVFKICKKKLKVTEHRGRVMELLSGPEEMLDHLEEVCAD